MNGPSERGARVRTLAMAGLTMLAFAANSALCRAALVSDPGQGMHPAAFTLLRLGGGAVTLAVVVGVRARMRRAAAARSGTGWAPALALWIYALSFSVAYTRVDAGTGALMLFGAVQVTMFGHAAVKGPRPRPHAWLGMGIASLALAYMLLPGAGRPDPLAGLAMAIAGVAWGAYSLFGRTSEDPTGDTARAFVGAALISAAVSGVWLALAPAQAPFTFGDSPRLLYALGSGIAASGLGYVLWYATLPRLRAESAAVIQLSVPVIAALAGAVWLGEAPSARVLWSAPAILFGIAVVVGPQRQDAVP